MAQEVQTTEKHKVTQSIRGVVISDKMNKTRVVEVQRRLTHSLYLKGLTKRTRIFVHDEKNEAKVGDLVKAEATRPLSKKKAFRIVEVLERRVE
jgi:small subunit ribosomal protein S17